MSVTYILNGGTLPRSRSLNGKYLAHIVISGILKIFFTDSHSLGQMEDIMDVILTTHKGKQLDEVEKCHIYQKT